MEGSETDHILRVFITFMWIEYLFEQYLEYRQLEIYNGDHTIPKSLEGSFTEEIFRKSRQFGIDESHFYLVSDLYSIVLSTLVIYKQWIFYIWQKASDTAIASSLKIEKNPVLREIVVSVIFTFIVTVFNFLASLPFTTYKGLKLDEKQNLPIFVKYQLKLFFLTLTISVPIASIAVSCVLLGGHLRVVWLWLFSSIAMILEQIIFPSTIALQTYPLTPMEDIPLKAEIKNMAVKVTFPLNEIYVAKTASNRQVSSNDVAFLGLVGSRSVVVFDSLFHGRAEYIGSDENSTISNYTDTEILAILAHQLGHWSCNHAYKMLLLSELNLLLRLTVYGILFDHPGLFSWLGFRVEQPVIIGLIVVLRMVLAPYNWIGKIFITAISRKFEFEADDYAASMDYAEPLISALTKLSKDNMEYPIYNKLYAAWYHTKPSLLHRIKNIKLSTAPSRNLFL